jgi:hypothetical protein
MHSRAVVDYMRVVGYDVAAIGEKEMNYGLGFLMDQVKEGKFEAVCANLFSKRDSALIFKPYVIDEVGGVRVAFLGLLDDDPRRVGVFQQLEDVYVTSYVAAAREFAPALREQADLVVALAHVGLGNARKLAEKVPDFDIVLVGHGNDRTPMGEKVGETILMKSGSKSSSIGTLLVSLGEDKKIVGFDGNARTLKKTGRVNPKVDGFVQALEEREEVRKRLLAKRQYKVPSVPRRPEVLAASGYLGGETCKTCHQDIYDRWAENPHAHAFATLAEGDMWNDPKCLPCHTTGYERAARRDSTDIAPEYWNVQCEACHGMGTDHRRDGTMKPVPESVCLKCHTPEWSPDWDYREALKKIYHGKDGSVD